MIQVRKPTVVDDTYYSASDGLPLGETPQHIRNMFYTFDSLEKWYGDDAQAFVAANMFIYYEQSNNRRHVSPDIFVTLGISKTTEPHRQRYLLWNEGKGPDFVTEYTSASTRDEDLVDKRALYQDVLRVREYFLFDPNAEYLDPPLQGHRLVKGLYRAIKLVKGRLPSEVLGLHLEADGNMLRLWNPVTRAWLEIPPEVEQARKQAEQARVETEAEVERLRREIEELRQRKSV